MRFTRQLILLLGLGAIASPPLAFAREQQPYVIEGIGPSPAQPAVAARPQNASRPYGGGFIAFLIEGAEARGSGDVLFNQPRYAGARPLYEREQVSLGSPPAIADYHRTRSEVAYSGYAKPGSIIVNTERKYLYFILPGGKAIRYAVGVARPGFQWFGATTVSRKEKWPVWTPPAQMRLRQPSLPEHIAGGPDNPLGARALYLGASLYRIHGTNEPSTIGRAMSSGCIRMMNADVRDLFDRVKVGARVVVM